MEWYYTLRDLQRLVGEVNKFQAFVSIFTRRIHNLAASSVAAQRGIFENQL